MSIRCFSERKGGVKVANQHQSLIQQQKQRIVQQVSTQMMEKLKPHYGRGVDIRHIAFWARASALPYPEWKQKTLEHLQTYYGKPYNIRPIAYISWLTEKHIPQLEQQLTPKTKKYQIEGVEVEVTYYGEQPPTEEEVKRELMKPKTGEWYLGPHGWVIPPEAYHEIIYPKVKVIYKEGGLWYSGPHGWIPSPEAYHEIIYQRSREDIWEEIWAEQELLQAMQKYYKEKQEWYESLPWSEKILYELQVQPVHPILKPFGEFAAGAVGGAESLIYSVGRIAGFKTPPPPPTLTGGLIGKGIHYAAKPFGIKFETVELEETIRRGPFYTAGTVAFDFLLAVFTGAAAKKAWGKLPKRITQPAERVYLKAARKLPARLRKLFIEEEEITEVQRRLVREKIYEPTRIYGTPYWEHRKEWFIRLEKRAAGWAKSQIVKTGPPAKTPFKTTLEKTVSTSSGQLLLKQVSKEAVQEVTEKTAQQTVKTLPTLTVKTRTVAYRVHPYRIFNLPKWVTKPQTVIKKVTRVYPKTSIGLFPVLMKPHPYARRKPRFKEEIELQFIHYPHEPLKVTPVPKPNLSIELTPAIELFPETIVIPETITATAISSKTKTVQKTLQKTTYSSTSKLLTLTSQLSKPKIKKRRVRRQRKQGKPRKRKIRSGYGKWFLRTHPVISAEELKRMLRGMKL